MSQPAVGSPHAAGADRRIRVFVAHSSQWPGNSGDAIHVWSVIRRLRDRGLQVVTQSDGGGPEGVEVLPYGRRHTIAAVRSADVVYVRIDGGMNRERVTAYTRLARPRPAVVWEINGTIEEVVAHGHPPHRLARWRRLRRLLARGCDAAVVISPELLGYARGELGIGDVTVVENGADPATGEPGATRSILEHLRGFVAVWAGSGGYPWLAPEVAVAAARLLEVSDPEVVVALVGGLPPGFERPLPSNVILLGQASLEESEAHLRAAGVALVLYHDTPWAPDGFYMSSIKMLQAWAAGVPVVATDLASLRRLSDGGERALVVADEARAVAGAISRLAGDAALRARLADAGRRAVRDGYNWDRTADELAVVIRRVAGRRRAQVGD